MSWGYYGYAPRMSVGELRALAVKNTKPGYSPVTMPDGKISNTWWGKSWCENLERYADAANRISRGRSYAKNGTVIDLKIDKGKITAKVQGSRKTPYDVVVTIKPVKGEDYEHITERCQGKASSLEDLANGKFPKEMRDFLISSESGFFPTLLEIGFSCSCPDGAWMCKHVAATLYAVGRRLDDNPLLFLTMRGIDVDDFADRVVRKEIKRLWQASGASIPKGRLVPDDDAFRLFGVERRPDSAEGEIDLAAVFQENRPYEEEEEETPKKRRGRPRKA